MNKYGFVFVGLIAGVLLTVAILWVGYTGPVQAGHSPLLADSTPTPQLDESGTNGSPLSPAGNDEVPPANLSQAVQAPSLLPTPVPGETQVYFVPTDNDATATVLYLYNTDTVAHIVALRGFSYNGVLVYSLNINVPATGFLRLASDSVVSAPPPSWATPAPIITNFTDFTYFASMSLPKGVKVEGYFIYNPGTGVVDPRLDQGAVPIRFSTDPATVFLPSVQTSP